ncbi:MAG: energy transducer TonB [Ginsengibacter sp.]
MFKLFFILLILFASCVSKNLGYYDTNKISRFIAANAVYPEDAVSQNLSALVMVKITFKKNGNIDSIVTLQSSQSQFSRIVIAVLERVNRNLFEGINKIPLVIPIYFLHGDENTIVKINYEKDFRPEEMNQYPFKCIFFKPIIIVSRSNIRTR